MYRTLAVPPAVTCSVHHVFQCCEKGKIKESRETLHLEMMLRKWSGALEPLAGLVPAAKLTAGVISAGYCGLSWGFVEL